MSIEFTPNDWKRIKANSALWWAGKLERPLIQIRLKGKDAKRLEPDVPYYDFTAFYDLSIPAEKIVDRWDYELSRTRFLGDAFPQIWPNFGPGIMAGFQGAKLTRQKDTVWFHFCPIPELDDLNFEFDLQNIWLKRIQSIVKAAVDRWEGKVQIGMTDLGGNLDILSSFRTPQNLILDLYDHPDAVKRCMWMAHEYWWKYFVLFQKMVEPMNPGYSCWAGIFSEASHYMLQCDFCYMISPHMFNEFVKPELMATANKLVNAFYHLDGPGQLGHLDSLLEIDAIKGIQWIPGDGAPDVTQWPDVYRKIQQAGKLQQVFNNPRFHSFQALDKIADQLGSAKNFVYMIEGDISQEDQALKLLSRFGVI